MIPAAYPIPSVTLTEARVQSHGRGAGGTGPRIKSGVTMRG